MTSASSILNKISELIKEDRLRPPKSGKVDPLIASESDKGRIINSSPFRRLQQKAQVFPLETNAAVRTRLTHSLEVSQIGRYIAQQIIKKHFKDENRYIILAAFVNTIDTACLLHDIGNPPFGHLGESAIKEWFKGNKYAFEDLSEFDGNPQGFRLISFISGLDKYGYNLTCTQLLSTIKYPCSHEDKHGYKKIGLYTSDITTYEKACNKLKWEKYKRFPFVYLMESADDIAYSMSDLEDGLEKRIITLDYLKKIFNPKMFDSKSVEPFVIFKTQAINEAVLQVTKNFISKFDQIIEGEKVNLINEDSNIGRLMKKVNKVAREHIYSHEDAERVELAGRSVITGLLNHFKPLLDLSNTKFDYFIKNDVDKIKSNHLDFQYRLFSLLPDRYIGKYKIKSRGDDASRRAHLIVDFISGMTDDYALHLYQVLEGIKIK